MRWVLCHARQFFLHSTAPLAYFTSPQHCLCHRVRRLIQDYFYRRAKEEQYRARSAYKLLHVAEITGIFQGNVTRAVDLCAAPGSWSQLLIRELSANADRLNAQCDATAGDGDMKSNSTQYNDEQRIKARVVAVDLQEMAPIDNVSIIQGDITLTETAEQIRDRLQGEAHVVVCDGAPDVSGLHSVDEHLQAQLLYAALGTATRVLCKGGAFVAKIFKGPCLELLVTQAEVLFDNVQVIKPSSSRIRSAEHFLVCQSFKWKPNEVDFLAVESGITSSMKIRDEMSHGSHGQSQDMDVNLLTPLMKIGNLNTSSSILYPSCENASQQTISTSVSSS